MGNRKKGRVDNIRSENIQRIYYICYIYMEESRRVGVETRHEDSRFLDRMTSCISVTTHAWWRYSLYKFYTLAAITIVRVLPSEENQGFPFSQHLQLPKHSLPPNNPIRYLVQLVQHPERPPGFRRGNEPSCTETMRYISRYNVLIIEIRCPVLLSFSDTEEILSI